MLLSLSAIGLILGMWGCFLTIKQALFNAYWNKESFWSLWEANQKLFRWQDKIVHKIARILLGKDKLSNLPSNVKTLREGNEIIIGFLLILIGFFSQLFSIIIQIIKN